MAHGGFIWADLSTFRPEVTKPFYEDLFEWVFTAGVQADGSRYHIGATATGVAAGLFIMPDMFQKLNMPSFWMPYFAVEDVERACEAGLRLGGKVELGPLDWPDGGRIALIRDPLGAGFTVYQGDAFGQEETDGHGARVGCALYISDVSRVREFYGEIFGWTVSEASREDGAFPVTSGSGADVTVFHELDASLRGGFEFWGVHFRVADPDAARRQVEASGGKILYTPPAGAGAVLAADPDGAAFFMEAKGRTRHAPPSAPRQWAFAKWRTVLGLFALYVAVLTGQEWMWGVLFLLWTVPALRTGEAYLVEPVRRDTNPGLFWALIGTWIGLSLLLIVYDLAGPGMPGG